MKENKHPKFFHCNFGYGELRKEVNGVEQLNYKRACCGYFKILDRKYGTFSPSHFFKGRSGVFWTVPQKAHSQCSVFWSCYVFYHPISAFKTFSIKLCSTALQWKETLNNLALLVGWVHENSRQVIDHYCTTE